MQQALGLLGKGLLALLRAIGAIVKWLVMIFVALLWVTIIGDYLDSRKRNKRDRR